MVSLFWNGCILLHTASAKNNAANGIRLRNRSAHWKGGESNAERMSAWRACAVDGLIFDRYKENQSKLSVRKPALVTVEKAGEMPRFLVADMITGRLDRTPYNRRLRHAAPVRFARPAVPTLRFPLRWV